MDSEVIAKYLLNACSGTTESHSAPWQSFVLMHQGPQCEALLCSLLNGMGIAANIHGCLWSQHGPSIAESYESA